MGRIEGHDYDPEYPPWQEPHRSRWNWPNIYSSPDAEDWQFKMFYASLYGAYVATAYKGLKLASLPVSPKTFQQIAFNLLPSVGTGVVMGAAYTSTVCIMAHATNSDGPLNHFVGGVVAGSIFGSRCRNTLTGIGMGIFLGVIAGGWKLKEQNGFKLIPQIKSKVVSNDARHWDREYTFKGRQKKQLETSDSLMRD